MQFILMMAALLEAGIPAVQVYILDAIAKMQIKEAKDAESIVERVVPRLQHANSAVVLSAVKVGLAAFAHTARNRSGILHAARQCAVIAERWTLGS
jgi:vesicle coat complex subunit